MDWMKVLAKHPKGNQILLAYAAAGRSKIYSVDSIRYRMWLRCIVAVFRPVVKVSEVARKVKLERPELNDEEVVEMVNDIFHYRHGIVVDRSEDLKLFKQRLYVEGLNRGKQRNVINEKLLT